MSYSLSSDSVFSSSFLVQTNPLSKYKSLKDIPLKVSDFLRTFSLSYEEHMMIKTKLSMVSLELSDLPQDLVLKVNSLFLNFESAEKTINYLTLSLICESAREWLNNQKNIRVFLKEHVCDSFFIKEALPLIKEMTLKHGPKHQVKIKIAALRIFEMPFFKHATKIERDHQGVLITEILNMTSKRSSCDQLYEAFALIPEKDAYEILSKVHNISRFLSSHFCLKEYLLELIIKFVNHKQEHLVTIPNYFYQKVLYNSSESRINSLMFLLETTDFERETRIMTQLSSLRIQNNMLASIFFTMIRHVPKTEDNDSISTLKTILTYELGKQKTLLFFEKISLFRYENHTFILDIYNQHFSKDLTTFTRFIDLLHRLPINVLKDNPSIQKSIIELCFNFENLFITRYNSTIFLNSLTHLPKSDNLSICLNIHLIRDHLSLVVRSTYANSFFKLISDFTPEEMEALNLILFTENTSIPHLITTLSSIEDRSTLLKVIEFFLVFKENTIVESDPSIFLSMLDSETNSILKTILEISLTFILDQNLQNKMIRCLFNLSYELKKTLYNHLLEIFENNKPYVKSNFLDFVLKNPEFFSLSVNDPFDDNLIIKAIEIQLERQPPAHPYTDINSKFYSFYMFCKLKTEWDTTPLESARLAPFMNYTLVLPSLRDSKKMDLIISPPSNLNLLIEIFQSINNKILISDYHAQAIYKEIANIFELNTVPESLDIVTSISQRLSSSEYSIIPKLLNYQEGPCSLNQFYLFTILNFLSTLSSTVVSSVDLTQELPLEREILTEQESAFLQFAKGVIYCKTGQEDGLSQYYQKIDPSKNSSIKKNQTLFSILRDFIQDSQEETITSLEFLDFVSENQNLQQQSHQALYLKNRLARHIGLFHTLTFDSYMGLVAPVLMNKTSATLVDDFFSYWTLEDMLLDLQRKINSKMKSDPSFFQNVYACLEEECRAPREMNLDDNDYAEISLLGVCKLLEHFNLIEYKEPGKALKRRKTQTR